MRSITVRPTKDPDVKDIQYISYTSVTLDHGGGLDTGNMSIGLPSDRFVVSSTIRIIFVLFNDPPDSLSSQNVESHVLLANSLHQLDTSGLTHRRPGEAPTT